LDHYFIEKQSHKTNDSILQWLDDSMTQFFQQRLRLLQIFRVKSFGEPAIDLGQQIVSLFLLALLSPQPRRLYFLRPTFPGEILEQSQNFPLPSLAQTFILLAQNTRDYKRKGKTRAAPCHHSNQKKPPDKKRESGAETTVAGWPVQACGCMNALDVRFLLLFVFIRLAETVMAAFAPAKDCFQLLYGNGTIPGPFSFSPLEKTRN
jgi:hypothetical protein